MTVVLLLACFACEPEAPPHEEAGSGLLATPPARPARNLVLITLDTVRRDRLTPYGYGRDTTPTLANLARGGVRFDGAITQQTNTTPSHASMLTGRYPHRHGSLANGDPLGPGPATLAELLEQDFETAAFISGAPLKAAASGLDRGFDHYDDRFEGVRRSGVATTDALLSWMGGRPEEARIFAWLHLYDAHGPYELPADAPPELGDLFSPEEGGGAPGEQLPFIPAYQRLTDENGTDREGEVIRDLAVYEARYDTLLCLLDIQVARVLEAVDRSETLVVVLSDHGEILGESPVWPLDHGATVFEEEVRIPFLLAGPGVPPGTVVDDPVETVDLLPTVLPLLGIQLPEDLPTDGRDLTPRLRGETPPEGERPAFVSSRADPERHRDRQLALDRERQIHALRLPTWKLIWYPLQGDRQHFELYDLARDPEELDDVAAEHPEIADRMVRRLVRWRRTGEMEEPASGAEIPEELREQLESLGYLGGGDGGR